MYVGGGLYFGGGVAISQSDSEIFYRAMIGHISDDIDFIEPNGSADFSALTLTFGIFKNVDRHNFGAGLTTHINPESETCFDDSGCFKFSAENTVGILGEYHYSFGNNGYIGVKLTFIEYSEKDLDYDGDSAGLFLGYNF